MNDLYGEQVPEPVEGPSYNSHLSHKSHLPLERGAGGIQTTLSTADKNRFNKVSTAFQNAAEWLHAKKAFTPEMLSEPEPLALISATHDVLAEELGVLERRIPDTMARA